MSHLQYHRIISPFNIHILHSVFIPYFFMQWRVNYFVLLKNIFPRMYSYSLISSWNTLSVLTQVLLRRRNLQFYAVSVLRISIILRSRMVLIYMPNVFLLQTNLLIKMWRVPVNYQKLIWLALEMNGSYNHKRYQIQMLKSIINNWIQDISIHTKILGILQIWNEVIQQNEWH